MDRQLSPDWGRPEDRRYGSAGYAKIIFRCGPIPQPCARGKDVPFEQAPHFKKECTCQKTSEFRATNRPRSSRDIHSVANSISYNFRCPASATEPGGRAPSGVPRRRPLKGCSSCCMGCPSGHARCTNNTRFPSRGIARNPIFPSQRSLPHHRAYGVRNLQHHRAYGVRNSNRHLGGRRKDGKSP